jgi:hypothetical protein
VAGTGVAGNGSAGVAGTGVAGNGSAGTGGHAAGGGTAGTGSAGTTGAAGTGGTGGVPVTCMNVCTSGATQCASGTTLQTCGAAMSGCTAFSAPTTCSTGLVCERFVPAACADPSWAEWPMPNSQDFTVVLPNLEGYTDNKDGTISDKVTSLMWQQTVSAPTYTWAAAVAYCQTLALGAHADWRLPAIIELVSIVDDGLYNPSLNFIFSGVPFADFWSSTTVPASPPMAREVNFGGGETAFLPLSSMLAVRCVR